MRLCLFSDSECYGGAEYYITLVAEGLQRRGHSVTALISEHHSLDRWAETLRKKQVNVVRGLAGYELIRWLRKAQPDILHVNLPGPYNAGCGSIAAIAKIAGVPVVVTTEHLPGIIGSVRFRWAKHFWGIWIDGVITETRANVGYLAKYHRIGPSKIFCIYHGIDTEGWNRREETRARTRESIGLGQDDVVIALIGRLHPQKGHDYLLYAASRLKDKYPFCKYLLVGDGEWRAELEYLVGKFSLQDKVHFLGFREDVPILLQIVDIVVIPSRMEGLPFVLLEAMAAGVPVVASGLECLKEVICHGENGFLIPVGDGVALAETLESLLRNRNSWAEIGQRARETVVQRFNLQTMLDRTEDLYRTLLARKKSMAQVK